MCVNCDDNTTEIPIGPPGPAGNDGVDGLFGGFSGEWLFSSSTGSGPNATELRLNNATYSNVTAIHVNDLNSDSIDYSSFLNSFNNSGQYGLIRIFKEYDSTIFWLGQITSVTDNGSDFTLTVTYILHNGTFAANDNVVLTFSPRGINPTPLPQRINSVFRQQDTAYVSQTANTFRELGSLVWDINTYSYPETAKFVVEETLLGQQYDLRIQDGLGNTIFSGSFTAAGTGKRVVDLGARLFSTAPTVTYLTCAVRSDGTNPVYVYSVELYNQ